MAKHAQEILARRPLRLHRRFAVEQRLADADEPVRCAAPDPGHAGQRAHIGAERGLRAAKVLHQLRRHAAHILSGQHEAEQKFHQLAVVQPIRTLAQQAGAQPVAVAAVIRFPKLDPLKFIHRINP